MQLQLRVKDRDEELKGKAKLLDVWFPIDLWFGVPIHAAKLITV